MPRYVVGFHNDDDTTDILGVIEATDIGQATMAAQERWPGAGTFPWDDATARQREQALLKMNGQLKL